MIKVNTIRELWDNLKSLKVTFEDQFDGVIGIDIYQVQESWCNNEKLVFAVDGKWYAFDVKAIDPLVKHYLTDGKMRVRLAMSSRVLGAYPWEEQGAK